MLTKMLIVIALAMLSVLCLNGCKKEPKVTETETGAVKTTKEYEAETKKQVDKEKENMKAELENMEKTIDKEIEQEK